MGKKLLFGILVITILSAGCANTNQTGVSTHEATPTTTTTPVLISTSTVTVSIDAPTHVPQGNEFVARVSVTQVTNLGAYQFNVSYNPSIIQVVGAEIKQDGVTFGLIDSTITPIDKWTFIPSETQGTITVLGSIPGLLGVTGSGYLAEIHFHVLGPPGQNSYIMLSYLSLFNNMRTEIMSVTSIGNSVQVIAPCSSCASTPAPTPTSAWTLLNK